MNPFAIAAVVVIILVLILLVYMSFTKTLLFASPFDGNWISKQDGNKFAIYTKDPTKCILTWVDGRTMPIILGETSADGKSIAYSQGVNTNGSDYIFTAVGDTIEIQSGELNGAKATFNILYRQA